MIKSSIFVLSACAIACIVFNVTFSYSCAPNSFKIYVFPTCRAPVVVVDEHAVDLVVAADALTPGNALLDADGVRSLVVSAGHFVHVVVNKTERGRVHDCGDVDAILLEGA